MVYVWLRCRLTLLKTAQPTSPFRAWRRLDSYREGSWASMLTLIEHGDVYGPEPAGVQSLLLCGETIVKIGSINAAVLASLDVPCAIIDANGCFVTPGFIDPHQHLIGAAGEHGFFSRMP